MNQSSKDLFGFETPGTWKKPSILTQLCVVARILIEGIRTGFR